MTILCVSEVVEDEEELIRYLHDRGLTPGTRLALAVPPRATPASDTVELTVGDERLTVPSKVAHALWVVPA